MGAAAIAARIPLPRGARRDRAAACGLAFEEHPGQMVALCGLVGGAGTSTLAFLLARQAALESTAPVLVTESEPRRAGLAVLAGRATPHPFVALARDLASDRVPTETFVELEPGLRLVAAMPRLDAPATREAVCALLGEARDSHGIVIVDCGTDWMPDSPILAQATHIIWTLPATPPGLARARVLLTTDVVPKPGLWREVLAATATAPRPLASVRALRRVAHQRCDRLVLIPHDDALARGELTITEGAVRALTGLAPSLRSGR